jgi:transcriptional regulator with XRE-family HTH domain
MARVKKDQNYRRGPTHIADWMEHFELTDMKASEVLNVDRSTVTRFRSGETSYDQEKLEKLAAWMKVHPADLLARAPKSEEDLRAFVENAKDVPGMVVFNAQQLVALRQHIAVLMGSLGTPPDKAQTAAEGAVEAIRMMQFARSSTPSASIHDRR